MICIHGELLSWESFITRSCLVCVSVMEALKKRHVEELEREVEKVKRLSSGKFDSQTLRAQQQ